MAKRRITLEKVIMEAFTRRKKMPPVPITKYTDMLQGVPPPTMTDDGEVVLDDRFADVVVALITASTSCPGERDAVEAGRLLVDQIIEGVK